jgi:hypothetical protein
MLSISIRLRTNVSKIYFKQEYFRLKVKKSFIKINKYEEKISKFTNYRNKSC